MIEAGLFTLLSNTTAIEAICQKRISPVLLETGSLYPAMVYRIISAKPGPTNTTSGFQRWRIQFDCFGETYLSAASLRSALRTTLEGYEGTLNDGTLIQDVQFIQLIDFDFEDDARIYKCAIEFFFFFNFTT